MRSTKSPETAFRVGYCGRKDIALRTAHFLKSRNPACIITLKDLQTGEETVVASLLLPFPCKLTAARLAKRRYGDRSRRLFIAWRHGMGQNAGKAHTDKSNARSGRTGAAPQSSRGKSRWD